MHVGERFGTLSVVKIHLQWPSRYSPEKGAFVLCASLCFLWQWNPNEAFQARNTARSMNMLACCLRNKTKWLGKHQASMKGARTRMPMEHRHCGETVSFAEDMLREDARSTVSHTLLVWYDTGAEAYSFVEPSTATKDRTNGCRAELNP